MELILMEYVKDNLPKGFLPYSIYSMMVDDIEVGRIVLREGTDSDVYYEGHVGYSVFEEFRGHNYAFEACLLLKGKVDTDYLLITCDPHNKASLRIIDKLGCQFMAREMIPANLKKLFNENEKEKNIYKWKITL